MASLLSVKAKRNKSGFATIDRQIIGEIPEIVDETPMLEVLLEKMINAGIIPDSERKIAS